MASKGLLLAALAAQQLVVRAAEDKKNEAVTSRRMQFTTSTSVRVGIEYMHVVGLLSPRGSLGSLLLPFRPSPKHKNAYAQSCAAPRFLTI